MKKTRPASKIGRKRRTLGWTLLTLGLLVAGVWVASGWWQGWPLNNRPIAHGALMLTFRRDDPNPTFRMDNINFLPVPSWHVQGALMRSDEFYSGDAFETRRFVALWPIPLLLWTPAALLLRSGILARRRAVTGSCAKCGYSLAGLGGAAGAVCPECGKPA